MEGPNVSVCVCVCVCVCVYMCLCVVHSALSVSLHVSVLLNVYLRSVSMTVAKDHGAHP